MTTAEIKEALMKNIGEINPTGVSIEDSERLKHLDMLVDVVNDAACRIAMVAVLHGRPEASTKVVAEAARWALEKLEDYVHEINEIIKMAGAE